MNLSNVFNWFGDSSSTEIPEIYPFSMAESAFVQADTTNVYARIITDVLERTDGLKDEQKTLMWDNCLASESADGLVSMVSKSMTDKKELFLIYDRGLKIIRRAKSEEESQIRESYAKGQQKSGQVYISFKNYMRTDMVKIYSALEYCTVAALSKAMNLSMAIQIKVTDLRASVGLKDSAEAKAQALEIATALSERRDTLLDAKDSIETAQPDLTATNSALEFITEKRSFYLGLPSSYIVGYAEKGLGDSGTGDAKAVERGLKNYYFSIVKPILEALFDVKTSFKSEDFQNLSAALEAMKTFELTSDELISQDNKLLLINKLFGFPKDTKGDKPDPEQAQLPAPVKNGAPPATQRELDSL